MKKILVLLLAVYLSSVATQAKIPEDCIKNRHPLPPRMTEQERTQRENAFDQRLGLTEEQKQKSKEIRLEGRDKIKPVIDKIKSRESENSEASHKKNLVLQSDLMRNQQMSALPNTNPAPVPRRIITLLYWQRRWGCHPSRYQYLT